MRSTNVTAGMLPVFSLLLAATLWGVVWYPLRLLEAQGLHGLWATLISYGTLIIPGAILLARRRAEMRIDFAALCGMALAAGWCNTAFILAMLEGTVVRVLLLFYLAPIWAVLLARWLLHERLSAGARWTLAYALVGAVIMLWDPAVGAPWPRGVADWLAVSSGFAFALSNVLIRRLQGMSIGVKSSASWMGVLLVAGVWVLLARPALASANSAALTGAVALGVCGISIMTVAVQFGVTRMPVHRSAVILLFELVAGALSAQWLTDETVLTREWIGGALILFAAWRSARESA